MRRFWVLVFRSCWILLLLYFSCYSKGGGLPPCPRKKDWIKILDINKMSAYNKLTLFYCSGLSLLQEVETWGQLLHNRTKWLLLILLIFNCIVSMECSNYIQMQIIKGLEWLFQERSCFFFRMDFIFHYF